jgi:hypothetical protein
MLTHYFSDPVMLDLIQHTPAAAYLDCLSAELDGLLSSLVEQVQVALAIFDTEMRYLAVSPLFVSDMAWLTSAGPFAPADVIGRSLYGTFPQPRTLARN